MPCGAVKSVVAAAASCMVEACSDKAQKSHRQQLRKLAGCGALEDSFKAEACFAALRANMGHCGRGISCRFRRCCPCARVEVHVCTVSCRFRR